MNKIWREFFIDSVEGQRFMERLQQMIDSQHEDAEKSPELARDHTQRAKGIREVIGMVKSSTAKSGVKKLK